MPPIVIAHRGASGHRPEHTLAAYELGARQGADYIEPDLVSTRDGHLVARHENEISGTTDVAERPEFADRRTTKAIDGKSMDGWFTEDFTLAELKTLRAKERIPELRPGNAEHDGRYEIPTFQEVIDLAARLAVGIYPETKHPAYHRSIGLPLEPGLVAALRRAGLDDPGAKVFVQSFEAENLRALRDELAVPLVQLLGPSAAATPEALRTIAEYADAVGPVEGPHRPARRGRRVAPGHELRRGRAPRAAARAPLHLPPRERVPPGRAARRRRPRRRGRPRRGAAAVLRARGRRSVQRLPRHRRKGALGGVGIGGKCDSKTRLTVTITPAWPPLSTIPLTRPSGRTARRADPLSWRWHGPALGIAAAMALATAIVSLSDGLEVRDTDKMLSGRILLVLGTFAFFIVADLVPRAIRHERPFHLALGAVARERWNRRRVGAVALGFAVLLRHLPLLSQPQGLPALPDRPGLRPGPAVARSQPVPRARPGPAAPRPPGHGRRGAPALDGLPVLPRLRPDLARRGADRVVEPDPRALVRHRARPQLDARRRLLPGPAVARPGLRRARPLHESARDRHRGLAAGADLRAPRGAGGAGGPEHRRVRVAARLRRLHGGPDRPAAAPRADPARGAVDLPRPDDDRHALLRLALRGRRHRRPRDRRDRGPDRRRRHGPPAPRDPDRLAGRGAEPAHARPHRDRPGRRVAAAREQRPVAGRRGAVRGRLAHGPLRRPSRAPLARAEHLRRARRPVRGQAARDRVAGGARERRPRARLGRRA